MAAVFAMSALPPIADIDQSRVDGLTLAATHDAAVQMIRRLRLGPTQPLPRAGAAIEWLLLPVCGLRSPPQNTSRVSN